MMDYRRIPGALSHPDGAASRGAALLVGGKLPVCGLLAPCAPVASLLAMVTTRRGVATR
jgi:hypothetical protein